MRRSRVARSFRSALPRGERRSRTAAPKAVRPVSIRAPARGATLVRYVMAAEVAFRSALPRGERHGGNSGEDRAVAFRSALPRGERLRLASRQSEMFQFRSALPRGERRHMDYNVSSHRPVSIRAPARGATQIKRPLSVAIVFRSALPRGERPSAVSTAIRIALFRSALPRGERLFPSCEPRTSARFRSALPRGERPSQS